MGFLGSLFEGGRKYGAKLIAASQSGETDKVKRLLAEGADVNARDREEWTALIHASRNGHAGVVELLLDRGADVDARDNNGGTALIHASRACRDCRGADH